MAAVDEKKLESIVSQQIQLAKSHDSRERETDRAKALDYYLGKMDKYVPVEVNKSKVVSRDVADTMGWMLPNIIKVFTASDRMAVAEPVGEEDGEFAKQATDGMNFVFWKDNRGYEVIYSATWDALLVGNGIIKTYYDATPIYTTSFHSGLDENERALLLQEDESGRAPDVLAQSEKQVMDVDPQTGMPVEVTLYDLKIKRKKADGKFIIECIPPENFLIDEDAKSTDEAAFTAHWERKTRSDLIAMGYDKDDVFAIPEAGRNETPEEASRRELAGSHDASDKSMELVDYYECFIKIDVDDDGEAELVRVCQGGSENGKLLHWETWEDENPFDDIPCEPIPHRWSARSLADETMDVQDIKTVLSRQALNNIYATNNPQRHIAGKVDNMDELVNPTFGGNVFSPAGTVITDLTVPFVANHAFEAMAQQDEVIQRRTGVSRQSMALDPDALQNQTAEASRNQRDASYSQPEQIARNMAEWGWSKVFRKLLKAMIKHQGPRSLMMNGKPIKIDPRFWNADMDVTINVGLGTGSRDRDMMHLRGVLETQLMLADRFMAAGAIQDAIDMLPLIIATMTKMAESAGIRNPEDFYPEFTEEKVAQLKQMAAQPKPDPKIEFEKEKFQAQAQMQMQVEQAKMQAGAEKERAQMAADLEVKMAEFQATMASEQQKLQFEREKLAEEARQKDLDREQQLRIEMMKMRAQSEAQQQQLSHEDKSKKREGRAKQNDALIKAGKDPMPEGMDTDAMVGVFKELIAEMSKPKRVVRGEDGRAVGVETVQ
jgi:D-ribose pyranose/furanose isomerase RbsD